MLCQQRGCGNLTHWLVHDLEQDKVVGVCASHLLDVVWDGRVFQLTQWDCEGQEADRLKKKIYPALEEYPELLRKG